jgi:hypothetical protein
MPQYLVPLRRSRDEFLVTCPLLYMLSPESISRKLIKGIYDAVVHRKMMPGSLVEYMLLHHLLSTSYHRQPNHLAQLLVDSLFVGF